MDKTCTLGFWCFDDFRCRLINVFLCSDDRRWTSWLIGFAGWFLCWSSRKIFWEFFFDKDENCFEVYNKVYL